MAASLGRIAARWWPSSEQGTEAQYGSRDRSDPERRPLAGSRGREAAGESGAADGKYLRRGDEPERVQPLTAAETAHVVPSPSSFPAGPWVLWPRTGLRLGELLALQWGDVDWNGRFLVQRNIVRGVLTSPKSHQRRRVDMSPAARDRAAGLATRAARALAQEGPADAPLGVSVARRARRSRSGTSGMCSPALLEKAELRQIRIHDLRHTYATLLLQAGAPITYVSQQLGHRDASITLRVYAHWLPDASRREADRLDTLQPSATPAQPEAVSDDEPKLG